MDLIGMRSKNAILFASQSSRKTLILFALILQYLSLTLWVTIFQALVLVSLELLKLKNMRMSPFSLMEALRQYFLEKKENLFNLPM